MERLEIGARPNWRERAEEAGFAFHTMHGEPYWDETSAYRFTLRQVEEDIEDPSTELHAMCREAAARIVASEELMERLAIPRAHWDLVRGSWERGEAELYGRFDLIYDGTGPARMIEYNADTPTSLFESTSFQWDWLEEMQETGRLGADADQFNGTFEALGLRFGEMLPPGTDVHMAAAADMIEDYSTVETMAYAARAGGMVPHFVDIPAIGLTEAGQFADGEGRVIGTLFLLYPWEDMLRDEFAEAIGPSGCRMIEPAWKAVLSNKGLLPVLWEMFEGHPNLLPSFFEDRFEAGGEAVARAEDALRAGFVTKPIFSREGASVRIHAAGEPVEEAGDRSYDAHPRIVQAYAPMPVMDGFRPVIGAWIVGGRCAGMGIREDRSRITQDLSRFKPHFIQG